MKKIMLRDPEEEPKKESVGGFLMIFCVILTLFFPLVSIYEIFINTSILKTIFCIGLIVISEYVGITLLLIRPNAVKTARIFLLVLLSFILLRVLLGVIFGIPTDGKQIFSDSILILIPYLYLKKSKRVKRVYEP